MVDGYIRITETGRCVIAHRLKGREAASNPPGGGLQRQNFRVKTLNGSRSHSLKRINSLVRPYVLLSLYRTDDDDNDFFKRILAGFPEENYLGLVFKGLLSNSCMLRSHTRFILNLSQSLL